MEPSGRNRWQPVAKWGHQLSRTQPGGGREHDHRPTDGAQALGDGFDLSPGLERSLLREATQRDSRHLVSPGWCRSVATRRLG
jgi:hypothetical protein